MRKLAALSLLALPLTSCSVYKALSQPGPADIQGIGVGSSREQIISRIGPPKLVDTDKTGKKMDVFEFQSGFHQASKSRALLYLAADVFTLTLAELVLWPLELTALEASTCTSIATYDQEYKVDSWIMKKKDGVQDC
jgi:hypothetical protein